MTLFSLSLAANILISQGPLDDVKQGLGPAVLWGPSEGVGRVVLAGVSNANSSFEHA